MSESALFIGWGQAVRGRETKALKEFTEVIAFYTQKQQAGEITSFEPIGLEYHGGDLSGFILIRGSHEQIDRLRNSEEFHHLNARGSLLVDRLGVVRAFVGEELGRRFADFGASAAELGG